MHCLADIPIHIEITGEGEAIVLLHGFGFDHRVFSSFIQIVKEKYSLYAVDLPGFGNTPVCDKALFLSSLMARLPARFTVIGWSLGGLFATYMAYLWPHRVKQLMNVASTPYFLKSSGWPGIESEAWGIFNHNMLHNKEQALQEFVLLQMGRQVPVCPDESKTYRSTEAGVSMGLSLLSTWDLRSILPMLSMPVTYLWGRLDRIVPAQVMSVMQKKYPQFQYILFEKSAHMPFLSEQQRFIDCLYKVVEEGSL